MSDPNAKLRMKAHRESMKDLGYKTFSTHLPADRIEFIKKEKKQLRLASAGDALNALLQELEELRQLKEDLATG